MDVKKNKKKIPESARNSRIADDEKNCYFNGSVKKKKRQEFTQQ